MSAVVSYAGKQFYVSEKSLVHVNLHVPHEVGTEFTFGSPILFISDNKQYLNPTNLSVRAVVLSHFRGDKIVVGKKHRRKGYYRKLGHRQDMSEIQIVKITQEAKVNTVSSEKKTTVKETKAKTVSSEKKVGK